MVGGARAATESVPEIFNALVFQTKPSASGGKIKFVNAPEKFGVMNSLKLSPLVKSSALLVTMSVPPANSVPEIFTAAFVSGECCTGTNIVLPAARVKLLLMVKMPNPAVGPGASVAPEFTTTAAPEITPPPPRPPPKTVTDEPLKLPLTTSKPLLTVVAPG